MQGVATMRILEIHPRIAAQVVGAIFTAIATSISETLQFFVDCVGVGQVREKVNILCCPDYSVRREREAADQRKARSRAI